MSHNNCHTACQQQKGIDQSDPEVQMARGVTPTVAAQPQYDVGGEQAAKNGYLGGKKPPRPGLSNGGRAVMQCHCGCIQNPLL